MNPPRDVKRSKGRFEEVKKEKSKGSASRLDCVELPRATSGAPDSGVPVSRSREGTDWPSWGVVFCRAVAEERQ